MCLILIIFVWHPNIADKNLYCNYAYFTKLILSIHIYVTVLTQKYSLHTYIFFKKWESVYVRYPIPIELHENREHRFLRVI